MSRIHVLGYMCHALADVTTPLLPSPGWDAPVVFPPCSEPLLTSLEGLGSARMGWADDELVLAMAAIGGLALTAV